ncbi:MAG: hypothetical protein U1U88_000954 [Lawsonella clevelandensis]
MCGAALLPPRLPLHYPRKFSIVTTLLLLCCIVLGGASASLTFDRQQQLDTMLRESEPSPTPPNSSTVPSPSPILPPPRQFMITEESDQVTRQYERAIINASTSAIGSRSGASTFDKANRTLLVKINANIPVYTARIGQALAEQV